MSRRETAIYVSDGPGRPAATSGSPSSLKSLVGTALALISNTAARQTRQGAFWGIGCRYWDIGIHRAGNYKGDESDPNKPRGWRSFRLFLLSPQTHHCKHRRDCWRKALDGFLPASSKTGGPAQFVSGPPGYCQLTRTRSFWCAFSVPNSWTFSGAHRETGPNSDARNAFSVPALYG